MPEPFEMDEDGDAVMPTSDNEVLVLELRPVRPGQLGGKGRELDLTKFSDQEREAYRESAFAN